MKSSYLILIVVTLVLGVGAQFMVRHAYKKWKKTALQRAIKGADAARTMLNVNGLSHVQIVETGGELTDHYDPRTDTVSLSSEVYNGCTVSALAIACHECGHAVQHAQAYAPARVRNAIVPVVSLASNIWIFVLLAGIFLSMIGLIWAAIILFAAVLVFQLVTLPVEFDASKRATVFLGQSGWLVDNQVNGARAVLRSAALTYVAAALASALQLIYLLGMARR